MVQKDQHRKEAARSLGPDPQAFVAKKRQELEAERFKETSVAEAAEKFKELRPKQMAFEDFLRQREES